MKDEFSSGAVVIHPSGEQILMVRSTVGRGGWGFPKGHIIPGEEPVDTAKREVEEETGLKRDCLSLIGKLNTVQQVIRYPSSGDIVHRETQFFLFFSSSEIILENPEDKAHDRAQWIAADESDKLRLRYKYVSSLIEEVKEWISRNKP